MALLRNDLHLYQLGFARPCYERQLQVANTVHEWMHGAPPEFTQLRLFNDDTIPRSRSCDQGMEP